MKKTASKVSKKTKKLKTKPVKAVAPAAAPVKPVKIEKLPAKELKKYKELLITMKKCIIDELNKNLDDSKKIDFNEVKDSVDLASDTYDTEFLHNLSDAEKLQVENIDYALEKLEHGAFGTCESCNKKIKKGRLQALPQAKFCILCQTKNGG